MSGRLPNLHVNFSDSKYKTLMHLLDIALPKFGDDSKDAEATRPASQVQPSLQPPISLFGSEQAEYVIDEASIKEPSEVTETSNDAMRKVHSSCYMFGRGPRLMLDYQSCQTSDSINLNYRSESTHCKPQCPEVWRTGQRESWVTLSWIISRWDS